MYWGNGDHDVDALDGNPMSRHAETHDSARDESVARASISALLAAYCHSIDDGEFRVAGHLFDHGTWSPNPDTVLTGDAVCGWLTEKVITYEGGKPGTRHMNTNISIDVDLPGGRGRSRSYVLVSQAVGGVLLGPIYQGSYHDEFVVREGMWVWLSRIIIADGRGDMSRHIRV
jgi:hypothetical protein